MVRTKRFQPPPRPVRLSIEHDTLYITLSDGRLYRTPLALYHWLQTASLADRHELDFRRYGIWWPHLENGIYTEEFLLASPTVLIAESWQTRFKRRVIIFLEDIEAALLRHQLPWVCEHLALSTWWGDYRQYIPRSGDG